MKCADPQSSVAETARVLQVEEKNVAKKKKSLYFQVIQNPAQSPTPYSVVTVQSCGLVTKKKKKKQIKPI